MISGRPTTLVAAAAITTVLALCPGQGSALTLDGMNAANQIATLQAGAETCGIAIDAAKLTAWASAHADGDPIGVANHVKGTKTYLENEVKAMPPADLQVHCALLRDGAAAMGVLATAD